MGHDRQGSPRPAKDVQKVPRVARGQNADGLQYGLLAVLFGRDGWVCGDVGFECELEVAMETYCVETFTEVYSSRDEDRERSVRENLRTRIVAGTLWFISRFVGHDTRAAPSVQ